MLGKAVSCFGMLQEFIRVGYYVNNEYADPQLREAPPEKPIISQCAAASSLHVLIHASAAFALPDSHTFLCNCTASAQATRLASVNDSSRVTMRFPRPGQRGTAKSSRCLS